MIKLLFILDNKDVLLNLTENSILRWLIRSYQRYRTFSLKEDQLNKSEHC